MKRPGRGEELWQHCQLRTAEMLTLAQNESDPDLRARLLKVAESYRKLAERAIERDVKAESKLLTQL